MDRDKRWERTQKAYDMLVHGRAEYHADSGVEAVRAAYERDETDEFIEPTTVGEEACIRPGDSVIAFNFRPDRMREITRALAEPGFDEFDRGGVAADRAIRHPDRVRGGLALSGRLPARAPRDNAAARHRRGGRAPAPRRRDREVPARHLLLRRRRGDPRGGRAARARAQPARRPDLRQEAGDERPRGRPGLRAGVGGGGLPLRDHQLRQRRHGRATPASSRRR